MALARVFGGGETDTTEVPQKMVIEAELVIPAGETEVSLTLDATRVERNVGKDMTKMRIGVTGPVPEHSVLRLSSSRGAGYQYVSSDGTDIKGDLFLPYKGRVVIHVEDKIEVTVELLHPVEEDVMVGLMLGQGLEVETQPVGGFSMKSGGGGERLLLL